MSKKILFIVGSLRQGSFNRQMANLVKELIGNRAEVAFLEYSDIPFMNQDIEFPAPEAVARIREEVQVADGIWIFTPEYNHEIPGVLKNLIDWLSRPLIEGDLKKGTAIAGKPVTISGAGGKAATADCREHLRGLLTFIKMNVMTENETGVAISKESFASGTFEPGEEVLAQLSAQADAFIKFVEA